MGPGDDPVSVFQALDFERPRDRIDHPEMAPVLARVDLHLPPAIEGAGGGETTSQSQSGASVKAVTFGILGMRS